MTQFGQFSGKLGIGHSAIVATGRERRAPVHATGGIGIARAARTTAWQQFSDPPGRLIICLWSLRPRLSDC